MRRLGALLAASALLLAAAAHGQEAQPTKPPPPSEPSPEEKLPAPEFVLTADVVTYDRERDLYEATGNVKITQADGRVLTSDWALFNGTTRTGVASGNVVITDAQNTVHAQFMAVDLRSTVSVAMHGSMDNPAPGFAVRGELIERTGVDTFHIENGNFSTCRCPPATEKRPWEIDAKEADVEVGGYAVGRDLWFKVFGVPVLYAPWLTFPVKTEKQTGFLLPSYKHTRRNGSSVDLPFYWAVEDNVNLMLTPMWVSRRGFDTTATLEYLTQTSTGHAGFSILPSDKEVASNPEELFSDNRWAYWLRHQQALAPGIQAGIDLTQISDNNLVFDFPRMLGRDTQHQRFLESAGWLDLGRDGIFASALVSVNNDLQSPNDLDRDSLLLQSLPDLRAAALPRALFGTPLHASISGRYTDFVQLGGRQRTLLGHTPVKDQFFDTGSDGRFNAGEPTATGQLGDPNADSNLDDANNPAATTHTEGDGVFEEGELLADAGHRLDFYPKLSLPLQLGIVQAFAEGGVRETLYFPDLESDASRTIFTARADARTQFGRNYVIGTLPLSHIVEPRVAFAATFAPNQSDNPLFIPEPAAVEPRLIDGDIRLVTEDPSDRVPDARLLQLQVSQRLYGPGRGENAPARLYGELRVGSGYDWTQRAFTRVFALADFHPSQAIDLGVDGGYNPEAGHVEDLRAAVGWMAEGGTQLRVGYVYNRNPIQVFEGFLSRGPEFSGSRTPTKKVNQVNLSTYVVATHYLELFAEGFKSLVSGGIDGGRVGAVVRSNCKCWDLLVEVEKVARTNDTSVSFQFRLSGIGDQAHMTDIDRRGRGQTVYP